jgi:hypothetical protein
MAPLPALAVLPVQLLLVAVLSALPLALLWACLSDPLLPLAPSLLLGLLVLAQMLQVWRLE